MPTSRAGGGFKGWRTAPFPVLANEPSHRLAFVDGQGPSRRRHLARQACPCFHEVVECCDVALCEVDDRAQRDLERYRLRQEMWRLAMRPSGARSKTKKRKRRKTNKEAEDAKTMR
eukprot:scaffold387_cov244-Pinguiococcus_pyrenoidosus.AAC.18